MNNNTCTLGDPVSKRRSTTLADLSNLMEINDGNIFVVCRILGVYINKLGSVTGVVSDLSQTDDTSRSFR